MYYNRECSMYYNRECSIYYNRECSMYYNRECSLYYNRECSMYYNREWSMYYNIECSINVRETEVAITNGHSRATGNIGYSRRRKTTHKHNTICVENHYAQNMHGSIFPVK